MIQLHEVLDSQRDAAACFAYAADFRNLPEWDPTVLSATKTTAGAVGVGTQFEIVVRFGPKRLPMHYEIREFVPGQRVVLFGEAATVSVIDDIRFVATAGGTRIDYRADLTLKTGGRWTEAVAGPLATVNGRRAIRGLTRALAAEEPIVETRWSRDLADRLLLPGAARFTRQGHRAAGLQPIATRADDRTVLITGATAGIGLETALWLARLGARLVLVGRDADKLAAARSLILSDSGNAAVSIEQADLALLADVRALAERVARSHPQLDTLINNAGALYLERSETREGHERAYAVNLLGPYALTEALLPLLAATAARKQDREANAGACVINVASGGMYLQPLVVDDLEYRRGRYYGANAYARAKRGLVALTAYWSAHWHGRGVAVHSMHPGWVDTPGVASSLPDFHRRMQRVLRTQRQGADTIVWLSLSDAARQHSGRFWFDRSPHRTEVIPGTAVTAYALTQLLAQLQAGCLS